MQYEIQNAAQVSFPLAWEGSQVCVSTDRKVWTRVDATVYDHERGVLCWPYAHTASTPSVYFAYFDPYDYTRQLDLVARCAAAPGARVRSLGQTLDGRELDCVEVGHGPLHAWVIHRQHPGESQASFFAEGLLTRLLGLGADPNPNPHPHPHPHPHPNPHPNPNPNPNQAYVEGCKRADAAKAAKRREQLREARAHFAPPVFACTEAADGECEVFG